MTVLGTLRTLSAALALSAGFTIFEISGADAQQGWDVFSYRGGPPGKEAAPPPPPSYSPEPIPPPREQSRAPEPPPEQARPVQQSRPAEYAPAEPRPPEPRPAEPRPARSAEQRPYLAPMDGSVAPARPRPEQSTRYDEGPRREGMPPPRSSSGIEREDLGPPPGAQSGPAQRAERSPMPAGAGSRLSGEIWGQLDAQTLQGLLASIDIPPRSPTMYGLWKQLIGAEEAGHARDLQFAALRVEALTRSGLLDEAAHVLVNTPGNDAVMTMLRARSAITLGDRENGCREAGTLTNRAREMPDILRAEALVVSGYCAAASGNTAAAALAADLAREAHRDKSVGVEVLDAIGAGREVRLVSAARLTPTDFRLLELAGGVQSEMAVERGTPALLALLARLDGIDPGLRLAAAEAGAKQNAIGPSDLAAAYRAYSPQAGMAEAADIEAMASQQAARRAVLYRAIEAEAVPQKKARMIQAFLDEARRAGLYWPSLMLMAPLARGLAPGPQYGWFAETGAELALASGDYGNARAWSGAATSLDRPVGGDHSHWQALADLADPQGSRSNGAGLATIERLAGSGRFDPVLLYRLTSLLDALNVDVPMPLWDMANRVPQPESGYLPETGVLTELQEVSKRRVAGHTVLLAMRVLGPNAADAVHLIALGDTIRALRRVGLEGEARRLALEALLPSWPRSVSN